MPRILALDSFYELSQVPELSVYCCDYDLHHAVSSDVGSPYMTSVKSLVPLYQPVNTGDCAVPVHLNGIGDWTNDVEVDNVHLSIDELIYGPSTNGKY